MPRGDRMGPEGRGPTTGRRMEYRVGYDVPEFGRGRGMNYGRSARRIGRGRGMGRCLSGVYQEQVGCTPMPTYVPSPEDEQRHLEECAKQLESDLEGIKERIQELKTE